MKIVVMRHGQPEMDIDSLKVEKLSPQGVGEIVEQYERTDLNPDSEVPQQSLLVAESCSFAISSKLPRALSSIQKLGLEDRAVAFDCFNESSLPYLNWGKPRASFFTWCLLFRTAWFLGFSRNGESISDAKRRACKCADLVFQKLETHESLLVLGHGIMNRLLYRELKRSGWIEKESTGGSYWSYKVFEKL
ncbi:histidine phosphatase family protein [Puniceicoccaceae bacterium K14]|nr:histidine phosphatase family protein [Puniceicoccaceae bacterium K14]